MKRPIAVWVSVWVMLWPSIAAAHAYLVKSVPARRATLFNAPSKIQLWFNERLETRYSTITVTDAHGQRVDLGNSEVVAADPKQLTVGLKPLSPGRYTVQFRVLSVDGHVVDQNFPFTIRDTR
ncbi:MAG TPA: copper resistance protein CopC [Candidatus Acidoferrales bacterium]|nr:copper resistance protein CopC [Candidatus Acidoferrales bacterium]